MVCKMRKISKLCVHCCVDMIELYISITGDHWKTKAITVLR